MANRPIDASSLYDVNAAGQYPLVTKANNDLPNGMCRGLLVGVAGTANLMDRLGNVETDVPLQAGYNPLMCLQVRTGGTADNIRALY
ncbi:hypothetical protein I5E68_07095 [Novosphingobium sp. YJ-S2-02]|uniref:Uncharacterized protein n=1 Tax=Novosphingobium aureum TaxID=2792964 RepID=A0A931HC38_9SPHN|nr:hypothetical protein [Novosphingobium aureum]MBH0112716.1 hypothetical protein [Novosphingobium aureum]